MLVFAETRLPAESVNVEILRKEPSGLHVGFMRVLELELASGVTLIVDAQPDKATKNDARLSFHLKVVSPPVDKREGVEQWSTITAQEAMVLIAGVARSPEGLGWMAPWPAPEPGDDE